MHPLHPMFVHFPIALLSASVVFDLAAEKWKPEKLRIASLYTLLLGLAGALVAVITGVMAEESVEQSGAPKQVLDVLEMHEGLGFTTFWIFAGLLGVRAVMSLNWIKERRRIVLALGLAGVAVLFVASYFGGSLVYEFGVGVAAQR